MVMLGSLVGGEGVRESGCRAPSVPMVQAAEPRERHDSVRCPRRPFYWTTMWRVFVQSEMRAVLVVVSRELKDQAAEVTRADHHHVVEHLAA